MKKLLVANRGEIAIRIIRAAADAGLHSVAVYSEDEANGLHVRQADEAVALAGRGSQAWLNIAGMVRAAQESGADAVHPGYGFLSESAEFAEAIQQAGLVFVGPDVETLTVFGDKLQARALAERCSVPVIRGSSESCDLAQAQEFFDSLPDGETMLIKAVCGGGGRGMRQVTCREELDDVWKNAQAEAQSAFGSDALYVEECFPRSRHIEVQIVGDGTGRVSHLGERECSLQRRWQKLVEVAPGPSLSDDLRATITDAAVRIAQEVRFRGVGTVEFLVAGDSEQYVFIEVNPRLQVEHTVTEEVFDVDLVRAQLDIAAGRSLNELGLTQAEIPQARGYAIQARINTETMTADGQTRPTAGTISIFEVPTGPGVRTDTHAHAGCATTAAFDSLLAKLVVHCPSANYADTVRRMYRTLCEFRIEGVTTNLDFLRNLLADDRVAANEVHTQFVDENLVSLTDTGDHRELSMIGHAATTVQDPAEQSAAHPTSSPAPAGWTAVSASMPGTVISVDVEVGDAVAPGRQLLVIESMKMQHVTASHIGGVLERIDVAAGETVRDGQSLVWIQEKESETIHDLSAADQDLTEVRADLQEVRARKAAGHDENRPDAVERRRRTGHRTARENVADLCDEGTFLEYGSVVLAAQRRRRSMEDLIENTTGDGMVCGLGQINGDQFGPEQARAMVLSYDYMVLAGTQGMMNHYKKDRMFEIARQQRLPVVLFAEGGGGRPGDTDAPGVAGLDCLAFRRFAELSALVPLIGITTGRCFAGNAVLLSCCDVIIATEGANIGVGGPAMIEGGGLGVYRPEEVGPLDVQTRNGVVDVAVKDETEAVRVARQYLSYFQGPIDDWQAPDQRRLRFVVPEDRLRYYNMRDVIHGIADIDSVLELRQSFGHGMITALVRVEGRPIGVLANNPGHLAGAIDADAADKAARFMQLCDAFDLPILSLCDCPGIMVGPDVEKTAMVRHAGRLFVTAAGIDVPFMTMITRKGYGLGVMAMAGGSFKSPLFTVTWPTGEFGGMGLEGAVKLGFRKELEAVQDPDERMALFEQMVAEMYERGKAVNMASHFELDEVIDPADSRRWITTALNSVPPSNHPTERRRPNIDAW